MSLLKDQIEKFYDSFLTVENTAEIKYEDYPNLPPGIRLFKKAGHVVKSFSKRVDLELLRAISE